MTNLKCPRSLSLVLRPL